MFELSTGMISNLFSLLTGGFIYAVLTEVKIPFISGYKQAAIVLFFMGMIMSALAGVRDNTPEPVFDTMNKPVLNSLMILGGLAVAILIIILSGINLPFISDYSNIFKIIAGIIGLKLVITRIYFFIA